MERTNNFSPERLMQFTQETATFAAITIGVGTAAVLGGNGLWAIGKYGTPVLKAGALHAWNATKWITSQGYQGTKYVITHIPTATIWDACKGLDLAKWSWSCIRHPLETGNSLLRNLYQAVVYVAIGTFKLI